MSYSIAGFQVPHRYFPDFKFRRYEPRLADCVVNLFQILGIFDATTAGIIRILKGCHGLTSEEIVQIFEYLRNDQCWKFKTYTGRSQAFVTKFKDLANGQVAIAGITYPDGNKHVFFIGRNYGMVVNGIIQAGNLWILDPQVSLFIDCGNRDSQILNCLGQYNSLHLLLYKNKDIFR